MGTIELDPSDSDVVESPIDKEDDFELPSTNKSPEADLTDAFVAIAPEETGLDVMNAGCDCCNFEGMPGGIDWQAIFAPHDFIVVAIGYSGNEIPLGHARLLHGFEMHAESDDPTCISIHAILQDGSNM